VAKASKAVQFDLLDKLRYLGIDSFIVVESKLNLLVCCFIPTKCFRLKLASFYCSSFCCLIVLGTYYRTVLFLLF